MHVRGKALIVATSLGTAGSAAMADGSFSEAISEGRTYANFNFRYEDVQQDDALRDASALTLRSRLGYGTGTYRGFSALLEVEDSRIVGGQDRYTVPQTGFRPGQYAAIADPETTELDQGFLMYQSDDSWSVKLGRQVIAWDEHRFVGNVGWRQDRQTFDAVTFHYQPVDRLTLGYGYISQRNRIFAEEADIDSKDHLLNAAYVTPVGTITAYGYFLEVEDAPDNGLDTFGLRFHGERNLAGTSLLYAMSYATQEAKIEANRFDADYLSAEAGIAFPRVTVNLGYELLGSDGGDLGFTTPLATLHRFNGWADQFLATPADGLRDVSVSANGALAGISWLLAYHDFSADASTAVSDDLGDEVDIQLSRQLPGGFMLGLKYAAYDAGDTAAGRVDTDKLWAWLTLGFE